MKLTTTQKELFSRAVMQIADTQEEIEQQARRLGRWLLLEVFADDTAAALDRKRGLNPVWLELLRRAGSETVKLTDQTLRNLLRCAAWDHRLPDDEFRKLDLGRKALLLPLNKSEDLVAAAKFVSRTNLTQDATKEYVASFREAKGDSRKVRVAPAKEAKTLEKLHERLGNAAFQRRVREVVPSMPAPQRRRLKAAAEASLRDLQALLALLG